MGKKELIHTTKRGYFKPAIAVTPWLEIVTAKDGTYKFSDHNVDTHAMVLGETYRELEFNYKGPVHYLKILYYNAEVKPDAWRTVPLRSVSMIQINLD